MRAAPLLAPTVSSLPAFGCGEEDPGPARCGDEPAGQIVVASDLPPAAADAVLDVQEISACASIGETA